MKSFIAVAFGLSVTFIVVYLYMQNASTIQQMLFGDRTATVYINDVAFKMQVAATEAARTKGLSGQTGLPPHGGMLFIMDKPLKQGIWMKDMQFPLDILWFDNNFRLIHYEQNVSPATYPKVFAPSSPARFVVEVSAHTIEHDNISLGARLVLPPILIPTDLVNASQ